MKKMLISAALAASLLPATALAQQTPAAVIVVVDSNRVANECNACKTAAAALRAQAAQLDARRTTLNNQLSAEGKAIQDAVDALPKGTQPNAALQARAKAWEAKAQQAQQELGQAQQRLQSTNVNILRQIKEKLDPAVRTVMAQRGANLVIDSENTASFAPALDVTNQVIAQLNTSLPSISATPLPQPAQPPQQQPQGR
jgi:outer membrane protein